MESQPQNPEFKNNPKNFYSYSKNFRCLMYKMNRVIS